MRIGTLEGIRRYPIKSLGGESLAQVSIEPDGLCGDRAASLIVTAGHARIGKPYRGKEHDELHFARNTDAAVALAHERGVAVVVREHHGGHDFDDGTISLLFDRWLDGVSAHVGYAVEFERFRPNLFVKSSSLFSGSENDFIGREVGIDGVRLRVVRPIVRCLTITYDLQGGSSNPEILRYLAQRRAAVMGVYCEVLRAGVVRIGGAVETLDDR